jgi:dihydrodipicolinate synthase/N-acetylneuraminate lyase
LERARHYQRATRQRDGFRLYDGDEGHFLDHPSTSGVISAGANLAPTAWERVTRFSLESGRDQGLYPDQLQQIWASGETLRRLKRRYQAMPVPIIKGVLSALGIIETPACTAQMKNGPAPPEPLEALMTQLREDPLCRPAART